MTTIFADTFYWIALVNPRDTFHRQAKTASDSFRSACLLTTDEVLSEFLTHFAKRGTYWREKAGRLVREIMNNPGVEVLPQTHDSFLSGIDLYKRRLDKKYSLTDCICMETMRRRSLNGVLTGDHNFEQERFKILLRE